MTESRQFHLGDALSITTDFLLSPRGMEGIYDLLNFMTGDQLFTHQLPRAQKECRPWLLRQHPQLDTSDTRYAVMELSVNLRSVTREDRPYLCTGWLAQQVLRLGEMLNVSPIPVDAHERKDPIAELKEMRGGDEGIVVVKA